MEGSSEIAAITNTIAINARAYRLTYMNLLTTLQTFLSDPSINAPFE